MGLKQLFVLVSAAVCLSGCSVAPPTGGMTAPAIQPPSLLQHKVVPVQKPDTQLQKQIAEIAKEGFGKLGISNINLIKGNFDDLLPGILFDLGKVDFAFIDGNHRKDPTLLYFYSLLNKINKTSILVFDDIHWSAEMEEAWELIKTHPSVTLTIDLFFIGIVFFRNEFKTKQHFIINF